MLLRLRNKRPPNLKKTAADSLERGKQVLKESAAAFTSEAPQKIVPRTAEANPPSRPRSNQLPTGAERPVIGYLSGMNLLSYILAALSGSASPVEAGASLRSLEGVQSPTCGKDRASRCSFSCGSAPPSCRANCSASSFMETLLNMMYARLPCLSFRYIFLSNSKSLGVYL